VSGLVPPRSFDSAIFSLVCAYPFTLGGVINLRPLPQPSSVVEAD
jgi:hypothetical protein